MNKESIAGRRVEREERARYETGVEEGSGERERRKQHDSGVRC